MLTRRRFLTITAAASLLPLPAAALYTETGRALGAKVDLRLDHPQAQELAKAAMAEIRRLEMVFSLYEPDATLARLNREGAIQNPPAELLECLSLSQAVFTASGGRFDPTIQPIWRAEAKAVETATAITPAERQQLQQVVGMTKLRFDADAIHLPAGGGLTLNGIAQGFIADRIVRLLAAEGLTHALIDTGEIAAMNPGLGGEAWPVKLPDGATLGLRNRAIATSSPAGMLIGGVGGRSHIVDPATGAPTTSRWQSVSISANSAGLADALSTAACLMPDRAAIEAMCGQFPEVRLEGLLKSTI